MKLIERFINLKDDMSEKEQYFDDVVKIMQYSYKNVSGGCPSDMEKYLKPEYFWKLVKRDGKIVAAIIELFFVYILSMQSIKTINIIK
jgi:hypothetical protein